VNRNFILQRDDPQDASLEFLDCTPKTIPVLLLRFASQGILQNLYAPFLLEIGPLAQYFLFEIFRESVLRHQLQDSPFLLGAPAFRIHC